MKAQIKSDGTLEILAETELEGYALAAWWDRYAPSQPKRGKKTAGQPSALSVVVRVEKIEPKKASGEDDSWEWRRHGGN